jgi:WD40-like Beta Propeller Repeat
MTDLERLLAEALRESGENYEPSDQAEARRRFLERARRRRWYGFAQAAAFVSVGVGAFVFFMYFAGTEETVEPTPEPPAGAPQIVATVEIGGEPVSIDGAVGSQVWVAGKDRVVAIDPDTNEAGAMMIDVGADEVAVGDDSVWLASDGATGTIHEVDLDTLEVVDGARSISLDAGPGTEITWDIATDGETLWSVDGLSDRVYMSGSRSGEFAIPGFTFTDVAVEQDGDVWALDQAQGALVHVDAETREPIGGSIEVPAGEQADLVAGFQYVYVSPGNGTLYEITPPGTTDMLEVDLGDSYMDLSVSEKSVWALVNVEGEPKKLFEINPATMEVIGEPLEIEGDANDVVAAAGSVWVADGRGEVLRIEPSRDADDAPLPVPDESVSPSEDESTSALMNQVVFVYSQEGDLYALTKNSGSVQLTKTDEIEEDPAVSPDGRYVLFERHGGSPDNQVVELDLQTSQECCYRGDATEPTIGADGQIAWVVPGSGSDPDQIAIGRLGSAQTRTYPVTPEGSEPIEITNLAFDQSMQMLYYEGGYEGSTLWVADLFLDNDQMITDLVDPEPVYPKDRERGAVYTAVSSGTEVNVLLACCRTSEGDSLTEADLGYVSAVAEQDYPYQSVAPVEDYWPLDFNGDFFTGYLGTVGIKDGRDEIEWVDEDKANWLVGDGTRLWVVDVTGSVTEVPLEVDGGAAAPNPLHR